MVPRLHRVTGVTLYFIPIRTRVPLKFGPETLTSATCLRVAMGVVDEENHYAEGWGETPLSVQWVWPSSLPYASRHESLKKFCTALAADWMRFRACGHALEAGFDFQETVLRTRFNDFNQNKVPPPSAAQAPGIEPIPWLAALVCNSAFDLALHDAFGKLVGRHVYDTYQADFLRRDLAHFLEAQQGSDVSFRGKSPSDYIQKEPARQLIAWHLVGGLDPLEQSELTGSEPKDGYPVLLKDWIQRDGLECLKIKLRGNDSDWDLQRLIRVAQLAFPLGVRWLTADFNCTVHDPAYVNHILDHLRRDHAEVYQRILYVEQPFPYELEQHPIDVRSVSRRKPLFLDESAHDWRMVRLGRDLGWSGVALKTCKTQTGAILSACWARAHNMDLMVQDLTNPMLAQVSHVLLASHVGTIMGVETNSMQFYPEASMPEAAVHPGIYQRREGKVTLSSIHGPGFGYRLDEISRTLPEAALSFHD